MGSKCFSICFMHVKYSCVVMTTRVLSDLRADASFSLGTAKREDTHGVCPKTGSLISNLRSSSTLLLTFPQG